MTTAEIPKFDAARATAILQEAKKQQMYPQPLPDSDETKVAEAERIVQLALQAKQVYEQAQSAGGDTTVNIDSVNLVLFEAQVTGGTEDKVLVRIDGMDDRWDWTDVVKHVIDNGNSNLELPEEADAERLRKEIETRRMAQPDAVAPGQPDPGPAAQASPQEPVPPAPAASGPTEGARWIDTNGEVWVIDRVLTNGVEAHIDGTKEKTVLPFDFLQGPAPETEEQSSSSPPATPEPESSPASSTAPSSSSGPSTEESPPDQTPASSAGSTSSSAPSRVSSPSSSEPVSDDPEYQALLDQVQTNYERAGLPLPGDIQTPPEMPEDLTITPDIQARQLHSQFNACAARAHYLLGIERQRKIGCKRLREATMKPAMALARQALGAKATVTEVVQQAEGDKEVLRWKGYESFHSDRESSFKDLFEIYTENVVVLSRDWTMRSSNERGS